jgi:hypothetical protein
MKRFLLGFIVSLILMLGLGFAFNQSIYSGWSPSGPVPSWLQTPVFVAWLIFNSGMGYLLVPLIGGSVFAWHGQSKSGRFSGMVRWTGDPTDGRGCQIFPRVTIGGVVVGTAVVPDALLEQWRYPSPTASGLGALDVLKIGRCVVALHSAQGTRSAWGLGAIHKAYPFLAMGFFALSLVTFGVGLLVTYVPVFVWGAIKVGAFRNATQVNPQAARRTDIGRESAT